MNVYDAIGIGLLLLVMLVMSCVAEWHPKPGVRGWFHFLSLICTMSLTMTILRPSIMTDHCQHPTMDRQTFERAIERGVEKGFEKSLRR